VYKHQPAMGNSQEPTSGQHHFPSVIRHPVYVPAITP